VQTVLGDQPLLYYRMDAAGYTNPPAGLNPAALNFGSAPVLGSYLSGTVPGALPGPQYSGFGTNYGVAALNNGVFSCVDAGNDPSFNPTGTQPFTVMTWFRAYPADDSVQTIMSHGTNWALNLYGTTGRVVWNTYAGGQVTSTTVLNDSVWHFVAGVYDGVTNSLYVDGLLNSAAQAAGGLNGETNAGLYLGGQFDYTLVGNNERYFAGALAQAAFFTNALTASQIAQVSNLAGLAAGQQPTISLQRAGSQVAITYTGRLLSSTNVAGPYSPVAGASVVGAITPATVAVTPSSARLFYRAGNP
jgi:hypothetical protein